MADPIKIVDFDALGAYHRKNQTAFDNVIGTSEDVESDDTIHGAKAYAKDYADEIVARTLSWGTF